MEKQPAELASHPHYMRPLDGLRAVACMLVIISHIGLILKLVPETWTAHIGAFGVVVFFSLSGFLMSSLYVETRFGFNATAKYMISRMSRIAPAYWVAIIFAWLLYLYIPNFHYQMTPFMMLRSAFFGGNQGVFWSLPPEIQFYVFFLGLWFSWDRFKKGSRLWLLVMAILCVVFIATRDMWGGLMLPSKLHIFLFGFLAAFLVKMDNIKPVLHSKIFQATITVITIIYGALFITSFTIYDDLLFPALVALCVASLSASSVLTRPLETSMMSLIGAASFSIYLFHDPILFAMHDLGAFAHMPNTLTIALMCVIALALPVTFHFLGEKPLNKSGKKLGLACLDYIHRRWPKTAA